MRFMSALILPRQVDAEIQSRPDRATAIAINAEHIGDGLLRRACFRHPHHATVLLQPGLRAAIFAQTSMTTPCSRSWVEFSHHQRATLKSAGDKLVRLGADDHADGLGASERRHAAVRLLQ